MLAVGSGTVMGNWIKQALRNNGVAGYRRCTLSNLTRQINQMSGEYVVSETQVERELQAMERNGQIFKITIEIGDCFALRPDPAQIMDVQA